MSSKKQKLYRRWLTYAGLGLVLTGLGLSLAIESAFLKHQPDAPISWVLAGTVSLVIFNAGLGFFGEAIVCRVRYLSNNRS